jgi:hypothetical protein
MAQTNVFGPGDSEAVILRKILATLQFGVVTPDNSTVNNIVNNATTNSSTSSGGTTVAGNVGGYTSVVRAAPAVTASSAYSAGNSVGGLITFPGALRVTNGTGIIESFTLVDKSNSAAAMTLIIFNVNPTGATLTDKTAFVYGANILNVLGQVSIATTDYVTTNSIAVATKTSLGLAVRGAAANTNLYGALVTTGTPTFASTSDISMFLGTLQD